MCYLFFFLECFTFRLHTFCTFLFSFSFSFRTESMHTTSHHTNQVVTQTWYQDFVSDENLGIDISGKAKTKGRNNNNQMLFELVNAGNFWGSRSSWTWWSSRLPMRWSARTGKKSVSSWIFPK